MSQDGLTTTGALSAPVVRLDDVSVSYGPVQALAEADFEVCPGECLGLVGHNGAGKSTLVNTINGRLKPGSGIVSYPLQHAVLDAFQGAEAAEKAGVRSVFQELSLCPNLTASENLRVAFRGMAKKGWRAWASKLVRQALDDVFPGHGIDTNVAIGGLPIAERQMVEIAIAFADRGGKPELVILDEPTSSLDASIARQLLEHIQRYCERGGAVVFITHMLGEVFEVASRIVVMKDGRITDDRPAASFTREGLVEAMGDVVSAGGRSFAARVEKVFGEEIVRLTNGLSARRGEIVGLSGLAGHGQAEALSNFYIDRSSQWKASAQPRVAFVGGDRVRDGVFPLWSITRNLSLKSLVEFGRTGLIDHKGEASLAQSWQRKMAIKTERLNNSILSLSGGNQQKVLFARALASSAPIIVMDDPMRGVDIGTKREVYKMIQDEADAGRTFLWYSTEIDEVLECDRVFVFRNSKISAELSGETITEDAILHASFEMQVAAE